MQHHLFEYFQSPGHTGFIEDVCITLICKTDSFTSLKRKDNRRKTIKILAPHGPKI